MTDELGPADTQNLEPFEIDDVETFPYALTQQEIADQYDRRHARRARRARMETLRARVLLGSLLLFVVLLGLGHSATAFTVLLLAIVAAWQIRKLGDP